MSGINKKKYLKIILFIFVISIFIIGIFFRIQQLNKKQIEDTNGDDKTLAIINDEKIEGTTYDYTAKNVKVTQNGNKSGVDKKYTDFDYSYVKTEIEKLSGIYLSNACLGKGKNVTYTITSNVVSGNLKIVITDKNNKILFDIPIDQNISTTFFAENQETYYVKFIGESANFSAEIKIIEI